MGLEFSCENTEDTQHEEKDNADFMCFFVRYKTKKTSDFEGKKTKETYPEFRGKAVVLSLNKITCILGEG